MGVYKTVYFGLYIKIVSHDHYVDVQKFNEHSGKPYTKKVYSRTTRMFSRTDIDLVPNDVPDEDLVYNHILPGEDQYFGVTISSIADDDDNKIFYDISANIATAQTKLMLLLTSIYGTDNAQILAERTYLMHIMQYH